MESEAPQCFIKIARVEEITGLSKSTLQRWERAGKFVSPVVRDGNTVLYDLAEVLAWRALQFQKRAEREQQETQGQSWQSQQTTTLTTKKSNAH